MPDNGKKPEVDIHPSDLQGPKIDRRTSMKLIAAAGLGGLTGLAGCTSGGGGAQGTEPNEGDNTTEETQPPGEEKYGGTVNMGLVLDQLPDLYPHINYYTGIIMINSHVFNGLLKQNDDGEIVGDLASDWSVSDDGTEYTFEFREGVKFHNGDTATAEDMAFTINRIRNMEDAEQYSRAVFFNEATAPDESTVVVDTDEPFAPALAFLLRQAQVSTIVHPDLVEEDQEEYSRMPVSTGPFKVTGRETGQWLKVERFEDYWDTDQNGDQLPYLDGIEFQMIPEATTRWNALTAGSIHTVDQFSGEFGNQATNNPDVDVTLSSLGQYLVVTMLCNNPYEYPEKKEITSGYNNYLTEKWNDNDLPTADVRVRQAVAKAIDREEIVEKAHLGLASEAHQILPPNLAQYYEKEPDFGQYYDPEGAEELLDEAGYTGSPRLSVDFLAMDKDERAAILVQDMLSNVGIETNLITQQKANYIETVYRYEHPIMFYTSNAPTDPWDGWYRQLRTPTEGGAGVWQNNMWFNEEFDTAQEQSMTETDLEKRKDFVRQANKVLCEEAPFAYVSHPQLAKVTRNNLKNVWTPSGLTTMNQAWLEES